MHRVSVASYSNRAKALCTCGSFEGKERVGANASRQAVLEAKAHLDSIKRYVDWSFDTRTASFFANKDIVSETELCPECRESMDMTSGIEGLIVCANGHTYSLKESLTNFHLIRRE